METKGQMGVFIPGTQDEVPCQLGDWKEVLTFINTMLRKLGRSQGSRGSSIEHVHPVK
jgi:hypothetical protein